MFDLLSRTFSSVFSGLSGKSILEQADIDAALIQVKDALLQADVPYDLVETFTAQVAQQAVGRKIVGKLKPEEQLLKLVHDTLLDFFGGKRAAEFSFQIPSTVMVMGLQGSGKTTSIAKMVQFVQKQAAKRGKKRSVLMASVDFYRPAAVEQLRQLSVSVQADFYAATSTNPVKAAQEIELYRKNNGYDHLFLDTAGRLHVDSALLQELKDIDAHLQPKYKLLVLDSMTGQQSLAVARSFEQAVGFQSAILTKMDSDTRGGAAFSFRYALKKPVLFVGVGEKVDDLDLFYPERAVSRILGMGDIATLLERAEQKIQVDQQEQMSKAMLSGKMTLNDFAQQMDMVNKMGSLTSLAKYIPGMGAGAISSTELERGEMEMKRFRAIINSMTLKERLNHLILNDSRKNRVARGAGVGVDQVNQLLQRFEESQQYVKLLSKSGPFKKLFR
jgi:signal recognition particle subunit SRP54